MYCLFAISLTSDQYAHFSVRENIGIGKSDSLKDIQQIRRAALDSGADGMIKTLPRYYSSLLFQNHGDSTWYHDAHYSHRDIRNIIDWNAKDIPFMLKVLGHHLYAQAKLEEKQIMWTPRPVKTIDITIPPYYAEEEETKYTGMSGGQWQRVALARAFMKIKEAELLILDEPSSALDPQAEYEIFKCIMELRRDKTTIFIVISYISTSTKASLIGFIQSERRQRFWYPLHRQH